MMISFHPLSDRADVAFSILLPTWNNLEMLKLCVAAIRKNSSYSHQIIVHVNEGHDGTVQWLKENAIDYTYSAENCGICKAVNAARSLARSELLLYLNDDMYVCPGWDTALMDAYREIGHPYFYLSGTMLEPRNTGNDCAIAPLFFGDSLQNFDEPGLLAQFESPRFQDFCGSTWPPALIHAKLWDMVGGFSIEFSPSMYSDPDLCMKLWQCGVRYFKGVAASRVYHFMSKSTGRVKKNNGRKQFLKKWGLSSSNFTKHWLRRGQPFSGPLPEQSPDQIGWVDKLKKLIP